MNWDEEVSIKDVKNLAAEFNVKFSIESDDKYIYYCFGDVRTGLEPFENFTVYKLYRTAMRLTHLYPDRFCGF